MKKTFIAGTRPLGPAEAAPARTFDVLLDPGAHVFTLSRKGFSTAIVNRTLGLERARRFASSSTGLPATIHVGSNVPGAIVTINAVDVGPAPVGHLASGRFLSRGRQKPGMVTYEAQVAVQPGEDLFAEGEAARGQALAHRALVALDGRRRGRRRRGRTYVATRSEPEPTRAEVSGGSFGWKVRVP